MKTKTENYPNNRKEIYQAPYGKINDLNTSRLILDSVGEEVLNDIVGDFLEMLDTSSAIYEKNGDYALGIFSSNWCRFLDQASRKLCNTEDNVEALKSGKWLCHESCWSRASKISIEKGEPVDIECVGGLRIYAVPIFVDKEIIGSINFGYGDPPKSSQRLEEIVKDFQVDKNALLKYFHLHQSRPPILIDIAKKRIIYVAKLIGTIVKLKQTENKLTESEEKYRLAYNRSEFYQDLLSHDIRNILQIILTSSEIAFSYLNNAEKLRNYLMKNIEQVERAESLISNVQKISKIEGTEPPLITVEICEFLKKAVKIIRDAFPEKKIEIKYDLEGDKFFIKANEFLNDVFDNILNNAVKYNQSLIIEILVRISREELNGGSYLKLQFIDNGIGIPDEKKERIFERFYRVDSKVSGMGLGLSVVKKILMSYNGKIWIEDRINGDYTKGSIFNILIPEVKNV